MTHYPNKYTHTHETNKQERKQSNLPKNLEFYCLSIKLLETKLKFVGKLYFESDEELGFIMYG